MRRLLLVLVALLVIGAMWWWPRPSVRAQSPFTQDVYVWQRRWTTGVTQAVGEHANTFQTTVVLGAQIHWTGDKPAIVEVQPDWPALQGHRVGLAVRIGPYKGNFEGSAETVANAVAALVQRAQANHVRPVEVQLDFDAAESQLDGYRIWVAAARKRISMPLVITTLPSWLKRRNFANLAREAGQYVLQVHSVERPASATAHGALCDPAAAQDAVERAGRLGVPFRVALPTYGYVLIFDNTGKYVGLQAEGPEKSWPQNHTRRWLGAQAAELAALIRAWQNNRPAAMTGIIWYRLPVESDRYNWRWPTLAAVMNGQTPNAQLHARIEKAPGQPIHIVLENRGNDDARGLTAVEVSWPADASVTADATGGFTKNTPIDRKMVFIGLTDQDDRLAPGERRIVGWLRLEPDMEVAAHVQNQR